SASARIGHWAEGQGTMNPTKRLLLLRIVLSLLWGCIAGPIAIITWKQDADRRAYARAAAAVLAKYERDCAPSKGKGPSCDSPPAVIRSSAIPRPVYPAMVLGPPILLLFVGWMWLRIAGVKSPK